MTQLIYQLIDNTNLPENIKFLVDISWTGVGFTINSDIAILSHIRYFHRLGFLKHMGYSIVCVETFV